MNDLLSIVAPEDAPEGCEAHAFHAPVPKSLVRRLVVPKRWGGTDAPENLVVLCPTGHFNLELLIEEYEEAKGDPGWAVRSRFGPIERILALRAWRARPNGRGGK